MSSSENHTRILDMFRRSPVRIMFPIVDGGALREAVLVNTSGGIAGAERIDYGVTALANASIAVASQAAEKTGEAKILIDPFLPDNPSRDNGWSGYLTGKNSAQGSDR